MEPVGGSIEEQRYEPPGSEVRIVVFGLRSSVFEINARLRVTKDQRPKAKDQRPKTKSPSPSLEISLLVPYCSYVALTLVAVP
jgi:hypothetical protein